MDEPADLGGAHEALAPHARTPHNPCPQLPASQAPDLKKRIESLIDRDYLERDDADPSVYNYLA
jgi:hypothetical protein